MSKFKSQCAMCVFTGVTCLGVAAIQLALYWISAHFNSAYGTFLFYSHFWEWVGLVGMGVLCTGFGLFFFIMEKE